MVQHVSIVLTAFSVIAILILLTAYLFYLPDMRKSLGGKLACSALLLMLAFLQIAHYHHFASGADLLSYRFYGTLLMCVPVAFFFFSRVVLFPEVSYSATDVIHLAPPLISIFAPLQALAPLAFAIGTAYTFWFATLVFKLRAHQDRFNFERFFFGMFALMALMALGLGLSLPYLNHDIYYLLYSNAVSIAVAMVLASLIFYPQLTRDIRDITELAYAKSKLSGIDVRSKVDELERLMSIEKYYENEDLSLSQLADAMTLTPHQLSELINTQYGYGYPRFVREHRIREAKRLLLSEPTASILSISMMTGFKTQSNFYTAFKEIAGESPGKYRKAFSE